LGQRSYKLHPSDGYRWVALPDTHGYLIDEEALSGALAFLRYYRPARIFLLGDHVDFPAFSRFDKPPSDIMRIGEDVQACRGFQKLVRKSAPKARIAYLKGNHEVRFQKHLWKHQELAQLLRWQGVDLPYVLGLAENGIEWVESGTLPLSERLIVKHGHIVRKNSAASAMAEVERNGVSVIMGHCHRLGQGYRTSRRGMLTGIESGCLCNLAPEYMEGQIPDWQQGLSFGSLAMRGHAFSAHTAPIIKGKVRALGVDIGA